MKRNVLIIDDEKEIVQLLEFYFKNDFRVFKAYNGVEGVEVIKNNEIDLVIVDIMMPLMDGYTFVKTVRQYKNMPIIIISAKNEDCEKIKGLDLGCDDYVTKPFNPLEILARGNAQLRRYYALNNKNLDTGKANDIVVGDIRLNRDKFCIIKGNKEIPLTSTEYKILELLMSNTKKVFTKKNIFESVWNEQYIYDDNAIMVHISKLRDKLEDDGRNPKYLKTIRGLGYRFEGNVNAK